MLLAEFWIFTPSSRKKWILAGICCVIWGCDHHRSIRTVKVYGYLEWISITLWSIETFPQVSANLSSYHCVERYTDIADTFVTFIVTVMNNFMRFRPLRAFVHSLRLRCACDPWGSKSSVEFIRHFHMRRRSVFTFIWLYIVLMSSRYDISVFADEYNVVSDCSKSGSDVTENFKISRCFRPRRAVGCGRAQGAI